MIERSDPDSTHALKIFDKMVKDLNELPKVTESIPSQVMFNNNSSNSDDVKRHWGPSPIASHKPEAQLETPRSSTDV